MRKMCLPLFVVFLLSSAPTLWAAEGCTVNATQGSPTLLREDQTMELRPGTSLLNGDRVATAHECRIDLSLNDLAGCRVLAGSKVEIAESKRDNMSVRIIDGNIILNLKKLPEDSAFKVETPTAIAAVRGTQFWGRVKASRPLGGTEESMSLEVTTFAVREGSVDITSKATGKTYRLEPGQALDLKAGDAFSETRDALDAEMQAMQQAPLIPTQSAS